MNKLTSLKYMEMKDISINISRNLQDLNLKCMFISLSNVRGTLATLYENVFFNLNLAEKYIVLCVTDASLQPYLDQINQIEEQVSSLEQAAYKLDTYSKKLGKTETHTQRQSSMPVETYLSFILQVYIYTRAVSGKGPTEFQCVTLTLTRLTGGEKW